MGEGQIYVLCIFECLNEYFSEVNKDRVSKNKRVCVCVLCDR